MSGSNMITDEQLLKDAYQLLSYWATKNFGKEGVDFNRATVGHFDQTIQQLRDRLNVPR